MHFLSNSNNCDIRLCSFYVALFLVLFFYADTSFFFLRLPLDMIVVFLCAMEFNFSLFQFLIILAGGGPKKKKKSCV